MKQYEFDITFPKIPVTIAILNIRAQALAHRLFLRLDEWEEDGLGPTKGFAVELSSGMPVLVTEHEHAVEAMGAKAPTIEVHPLSGNDDVDLLLEEVLREFGLDETAVQTKRINNSNKWTFCKEFG